MEYNKWAMGKETWDESEFQKLITRQLSKDFFIEEQVSGEHYISNSSLFIDAVIRPKDTSGWRNKNVAIGIEFKNPLNITSNQYTTNWIR
jgi:hypothetical protein